MADHKAALEYCKTTRTPDTITEDDSPLCETRGIINLAACYLDLTAQLEAAKTPAQRLNEADCNDDEAYQAAIDANDAYVGALQYRGNTVSYIKSKADNYGGALVKAWGLSGAKSGQSVLERIPELVSELEAERTARREERVVAGKLLERTEAAEHRCAHIEAAGNAMEHAMDYGDENDCIAAGNNWRAIRALKSAAASPSVATEDSPQGASVSAADPTDSEGWSKDPNHWANKEDRRKKARRVQPCETPNSRRFADRREGLLSPAESWPTMFKDEAIIEGTEQAAKICADRGEAMGERNYYGAVASFQCEEAIRAEIARRKAK